MLSNYKSLPDLLKNPLSPAQLSYHIERSGPPGLLVYLLPLSFFALGGVALNLDVGRTGQILLSSLACGVGLVVTLHLFFLTRSPARRRAFIDSVPPPMLSTVLMIGVPIGVLGTDADPLGWASGLWVAAFFILAMAGLVISRDICARNQARLGLSPLSPASTARCAQAMALAQKHPEIERYRQLLIKSGRNALTVMEADLIEAWPYDAAEQAEREAEHEQSRRFFSAGASPG